MIYSLLFIWGLCTANAEEDSPNKKGSGIELSDTISGKEAPKLSVDDLQMSSESVFEDALVGKYPERINNGADWLKMSPEFVWGCWRVMNGLYERDWDNFDTILKEVRNDFPDSGVASAGKALKYQVMMLENFDFRYEKQYDRAFKMAQQELEQAQFMRGNEAWEAFLMGAMLGVDGIHAMRKEEWLRAINRGYDGVNMIAKAKELAPKFIDAQLGDGLWYYWRSLIAMNVKGIPKFADMRKEGIQMMLNAEQNSVFLRPAAGHALTYTWIEEGEKKKAIDTAERLRKIYPKNIINLQVLGRAYLYAKKYKKSEEAFLRVLEIDPENQRVHYYLSRLYLRQKRYQEAELELRTYLTFDLMKYHEGYAYYFLGKIHQRQKRWRKAEKAYKMAFKIQKIKNAKKLAKAMKERQKKSKSK